MVKCVLFNIMIIFIIVQFTKPSSTKTNNYHLRLLAVIVAMGYSNPCIKLCCFFGLVAPAAAVQPQLDSKNSCITCFNGSISTVFKLSVSTIMYYNAP